MIVNHDHTKAQTNFAGQTAKFGIADMSIVIELLTKLYSNPRRTLTQEYISNARDANRESGSKTPIKIIAPAKLNSVLIIRDYGPGLSPERIQNIFLYYGASTKNVDNTQTGGFGIGAKSAWAYTDSFTVTSFIDGIKRSYVAHKSSGNGNLDKVFEGPTEEPNGTEIQIPVKKTDIHYFKAAVLRTVYFWEEEEKPTLVGFEDANSQELGEFKLNEKVFLLPDGVPDFVLNDSYAFHRHTYGNNSFVVVDGIPYRLLGNLAASITKLSNKVKPQFYIKLKTGDLKIAPTREDIIDSDDNFKVLEAICKAANKDVEYYAKDDLKKYNNTNDKIKRFIELHKTFYIESDCDGYTIRNSFLIHDGFSKTGLFALTKNYDDKLSKREKSAVALNNLSNVYHYDRNTNESAAKRDFRFRKLIEKVSTDTKNSWPEIYVLISPPKKARKGDDLANYIPQATFDRIILDLKAKDILKEVDVDDFSEPPKAVKKPPKKTFCLHVFDGYSTESEYIEFDTKDMIVYNSTKDNNYARRGNYEFRRLTAYMDQIKVKYGFISPTSVVKIENLPNFVKLDDWVKAHVPSEEIIRKVLLHKNAGSYKRFAFLSSESKNILDPELKEILDNFTISGKIEIDIPDEFAKTIRDTAFYKKYEKYLSDSYKVITGFWKKYPLLGAISEHTLANDKNLLKEMVRYINMIYEESTRKDGN